jgi:hypothetical protein
MSYIKSGGFIFSFCFLIILLFFVWLLPADLLSSFFHDDSFFYMQIAYNYSHGLGHTFDGIHFTDGFHSLYMLLLAGISFFFPIANESGQRIVATTDLFLFFIGLLFIDKALFKIQTNVQSRILIIGVFIFSFSLKDFGMESRLIFPVFALFIAKVLTPDPNRMKILIIASATVLIRFDYIIFPFSLLVFYYFDDLRNKEFLKNIGRNFLYVFIPIGFTMLNLIIHKILFGHFSSISSSLKGSHMPFPETFHQNVGHAHYWKIYFILITSVVTFVLSIFIKKKYLVVPALFSAFYILILSVFLRGSFNVWYLNILQTFNLISIVLLLINIKAAQIFFKPLPAYFMLTCLVAVTFISTLNRSLIKRPAMNIISYSKNLDKYVPKDGKIFQVDESGRVGYFSHLHVINGDGLVNDREYREYLLSNNLEAYWKKENIQFISYNVYKPGDTLKILVPKWTSKSAYIVISNPTPVYTVGRNALFRITDNDISFIY